MRDEDRFRTYLLDRYKQQPGCRAMRIESTTSPGVPDVFVAWQGDSYWLELKVARAYSVRFEPSQLAWHRRYRRTGCRAFVLVNRDNLVLLYKGSRVEKLAMLGTVRCPASYKANYADPFLVKKLHDFATR